MFRNRRIRLVVAIATMVLPWAVKHRLLKWLLGYEFGRDSRIGFSIVAVSSMRMGEGAKIGNLTVCRGLKKLDLGDFSFIGNLNWISGDDANPLPFGDTGSRAEVELEIGSHSAITNRHYIDCLGGVRIGDFSTIAGVHSQFITHSINLKSSRQQARPIVIGDYCFVGTGSTILHGAHLPSYSVLGAGSILRTDYQQEWTLYAGVPAEPKSKIPDHYKYFSRKIGFVD